MGLADAHGTIKTRSGTWKWRVTERRGWPKSEVKGRRLGFEDPSDTVNRMSLQLELDMEDITEEEIRNLSLVPGKRRFGDAAGGVWIAHPVEREPTRRVEPVGRISLHSLTHGSKIAELPPDRTLGDMKNEELAALV